MFESLKSRDFALLFVGQSISLIGDGVFTVALALAALGIDHTPRTLAFAIAARTLPMLILLLFSGVIVDRLPRRLIMLGSDLTRGAMVLLLAWLEFRHRLDFRSLIAISAVFGLADAFFYPASNAIVPELLPVGALANGNGLMSASQQLTAQLSGPALGGLVVSVFGTGTGFLFDAGTFAASSVCLALIHGSKPEACEVRSRLRAELKEGINYVRSNRWLWVTALVASVANAIAFSPTAVIGPLMVKEVLKGSALDLGLVLAAGGGGGLIGALVVGRYGSPKRDVTAMWIAWSLSGLADFLAAFSGSVAVFGVAVFVETIFLIYGVALWNPLIQRMVPNELLGRVSSIDWLLSLGLAPIGIVFAGSMAALIGVRQVMAIGGAITVIAGLVVFIPGVRDPERDRVDG
ncbi:MAG: MFS transporter [Acidimicrobiaceae bacterium]|nr:MFS transporter [Acidimicrobiaceae bacterium]